MKKSQKANKALLDAIVDWDQESLNADFAFEAISRGSAPLLVEYLEDLKKAFEYARPTLNNYSTEAKLVATFLTASAPVLEQLAGLLSPTDANTTRLVIIAPHGRPRKNGKLKLKPGQTATDALDSIKQAVAKYLIRLSETVNKSDPQTVTSTGFAKAAIKASSNLHAIIRSLRAGPEQPYRLEFVRPRGRLEDKSTHRRFMREVQKSAIDAALCIADEQETAKGRKNPAKTSGVALEMLKKNKKHVSWRIRVGQWATLGQFYDLWDEMKIEPERWGSVRARHNKLNVKQASPQQANK